jgi:CBS domain-containing protein
MRIARFGCLDLPVVVDNRLIGMVSARELLAVQAQLYGVAV